VLSELESLDKNEVTSIDEFELLMYILKFSAPLIPESMMHVINLNLHTIVFPNDFRTCKITLLDKNRKKMNFNNYRYRPISVLPYE
jgi:hypothetical protein